MKKIIAESADTELEQQTRDEGFMRRAIEQARQAEAHDEIPVGAVLVAGGKVISEGFNQSIMLNDPSAHAEMQAITAASNFLGGKYLHGCTLYVTLEPCQMCAGALYWSQISKVVYGAADLERGFNVMGGMLHPKTEVVGGILENEASELLKRFFIQRRNLN